MGGAGGDCPGPASGADVSGDCGAWRYGHADGAVFAVSYVWNTGDFRAACTCGGCGCPSAVYRRRVSAGRLWREGRRISASHLAAKGTSGRSGSGIRAALRYSDESRYLWCAHFKCTAVFWRSGLGSSAPWHRCPDDVRRGAACRVLDRPEADAGLLLDVSDRIYPDRHWHAGPACGRT